MKSRDGYLTQQSSKRLGHFSRGVTDYKTGEEKRQQRAFIGPVKQFTKIKARDALRGSMVSELGLTAEARMPNMPGYSICCSPNFLGTSPKNLSRFD